MHNFRYIVLIDTRFLGAYLTLRGDKYKCISLHYSFN